MRTVSAGVFVTGTDTGVGKTLVACALVRELVRRGTRVGAMKPVETGVGPRGPLDAQALQQAAGGRDPLELVCPERFALPAAPSVAARATEAGVPPTASQTGMGSCRGRGKTARSSMEALCCPDQVMRSSARSFSRSSSFSAKSSS